jgi:ATP-dependent protease Clp ATPase subunit
VLATLIMGPGVGICDDCVAPATTVVRDGVPAHDIRTSVSPAHEGRKCSFCSRKAGPKLTMARADSGAVAICAGCLDLCHEVMAAEDVEASP